MQLLDGKPERAFSGDATMLMVRRYAAAAAVVAVVTVVGMVVTSSCHLWLHNNH